jgi:hypothetical protein
MFNKYEQPRQNPKKERLEYRGNMAEEDLDNKIKGIEKQLAEFEEGGFSMRKAGEYAFVSGCKTEIQKLIDNGQEEEAAQLEDSLTQYLELKSRFEDLQADKRMEISKGAEIFEWSRSNRLNKEVVNLTTETKKRLRKQTFESELNLLKEGLDFNEEEAQMFAAQNVRSLKLLEFLLELKKNNLKPEEEQMAIGHFLKPNSKKDHYFMQPVIAEEILHNVNLLKENTALLYNFDPSDITKTDIAEAKEISGQVTEVKDLRLMKLRPAVLYLLVMLMITGAGCAAGKNQNVIRTVDEKGRQVITTYDEHGGKYVQIIETKYTYGPLQFYKKEKDSD